MRRTHFPQPGSVQHGGRLASLIRNACDQVWGKIQWEENTSANGTDEGDLTIYLINDGLKPPLHLSALQPLLTPDHEEIQEEQEEECQCIDYLSTLASHSKTGGSRMRMRFE